ncbi:651_t:CDS:2 [Paraglomus brasilianum]|uniref:651_t:CDS:1 n=1 Tax=Paraglomus brasilianum TaxID=144538 RepID=A0A9N9GLN4_9GLOM|nr:651_t:CDS:2 [Paraglomus brasilianum]
MASANKILMLLVLITVLFATLATSTPIPDLDKRAPVMHVSAPRSGFFWAQKSLQNVSWWCTECKATDGVKIKIICNGKSAFSTTGNNANTGQKDIKVDPAWAPEGASCSVKVVLKSNSNVFGTSNGSVIIVKTQE